MPALGQAVRTHSGKRGFKGEALTQYPFWWITGHRGQKREEQENFSVEEEILGSESVRGGRSEVAALELGS